MSRLSGDPGAAPAVLERTGEGPGRRFFGGHARSLLLWVALLVVCGCVATTGAKLLPPERVDRDREPWHCLREALSAVRRMQLPPLDDAPKAPLGGRPTEGFLRWNIAGDARPVVDTQGRPFSRAGLKDLAGATGDISDRYVLCVLALGYQWAPE
jgi:hypothetical protein